MITEIGKHEAAGPSSTGSIEGCATSTAGLISLLILVQGGGGQEEKYLWRPDMITEISKHEAAGPPGAGSIEGGVTSSAGFISLLDSVQRCVYQNHDIVIRQGGL